MGDIRSIVVEKYETYGRGGVLKTQTVKETDPTGLRVGSLESTFP